MAATKLFLVTKNDTVIQATSYLVRAHSYQHANDLVDSGMYIEETKPEIMDTIESVTVDTVEIEPEGIGQER